MIASVRERESEKKIRGGIGKEGMGEGRVGGGRESNGKVGEKRGRGQAEWGREGG